MALPPGLAYLSRTLPVLLLPSATVFVLLQRFYTLQWWIPYVAAVVAQPAMLTLNILLSLAWERWDARQLGSQRIPTVPDVPGGFRSLKTLGEFAHFGYPAEAIRRWMEQLDSHTILCRLLFENRIFTTEPNYVKAILATDFNNYWKGPVEGHRGAALLGSGVFNTDDEMWKFHRGMTRPFFSRDRISDFDTFDKHAKEALDQTVARLSEGFPVDFQDVVSRFTLDSATKFLFGHSVDSLSAGLPYPNYASERTSATFLNHPSNKFVDAFMDGQQFHVDRSRFGSKWELNEFWEDKVMAQRKVQSWIASLIPSLMALWHKSPVAASKKEMWTAKTPKVYWNSWSKALKAHKQVIRDEILNMLVAGRDTTAATLTSSLYMLAEHPRISDRLRSEILNTVGNNRPTHEDIKKMPYLRAFLNETLRMYPPVPVDGRTSKKATTWPVASPGLPLYVPANTKIIYSVFLMHRRTDLWGPTALEFDPDRFIDDRLHKYLTPNPYIFLPFNAGPRICLGQQFAYQEASFFLIRLLQRFSTFHLASDAQPEGTLPPKSWETCPYKKHEKVTFGGNLTMYFKGGLWATMVDAS
ncbi:unnamed protein product [Mycena citricolor]|uniref:Cytochrome P450 n=1 Tax=Mycena citricolor TaxID=2018698 RepID=A0AAD2HJ84_9AGAR|nr:unnamed protein product [Mycena citricolor]